MIGRYGCLDLGLHDFAYILSLYMGFWLFPWIHLRAYTSDHLAECSNFFHRLPSVFLFA